MKTTFFIFLSIYSRCDVTASGAARHTTVCLDTHENQENSQSAGDISPTQCSATSAPPVPDSVVNTTPPGTNRQLVEDECAHGQSVQVSVDPEITSAMTISTERMPACYENGYK